MASEIIDLKRRLNGVAAVPVCPFNATDERIDDAGYREQIRYLCTAGIDTIVPCGNTTEFYSLSLAEIGRLNEITFEAAQGDVPVIVGIGHDLQTAITLARNAEAAGASAVMVHQPNQPFISSQGIVKYLIAISEAVEIGVILYVRKEMLSSADYRTLFEFGNIIGVKHATNDLQFLAELVKETQQYDVAWICGSAEGWAPFYHMVGARGFTSGLANVFPHITLKMRDALRVNDFENAMAVWRQVAPFEAMRAKENSAFNVAVVKEALNLTGRRGGVVRKPASGLRELDRKVLIDLVDGFQRQESLLAGS